MVLAEVAPRGHVGGRSVGDAVAVKILALVRTLEAHGATVVASSTVELTADESVAPGPEARATLRAALDALASAT